MMAVVVEGSNLILPLEGLWFKWSIEPRYSNKGRDGRVAVGFNSDGLECTQ